MSWWKSAPWSTLPSRGADINQIILTITVVSVIKEGHEEVMIRKHTIGGLYFSWEGSKETWRDIWNLKDELELSQVLCRTVFQVVHRVQGSNTRQRWTCLVLVRVETGQDGHSRKDGSSVGAVALGRGDIQSMETQEGGNQKNKSSDLPLLTLTSSCPFSWLLPPSVP